MSKAEERAQYLGYGTDPLNRAEYTANEVREAFIDGYNQAEKDLELGWEYIEKIDDITLRLDVSEESRGMSNQEFYQEVLKRFNKERKEKSC